MVIEATLTGSWKWHMPTGLFEVNRRWAAILGDSLEEILPVNAAFRRERYHPDDLPLSDRLMELLLSGNSELYEFEARIRHKEGHWVWVLERAKVFERDMHGAPLTIVGSSHDITERKQAEETAEASLRFERLAAELSNRFINLRSDKIDSMVQSTLKLIGEEIGADRSYVFQFSGDMETMDNTHEWCEDGIDPQIDMLKDIPTGDYVWWMGKIRRNEIIHIPLIEEMPEEAAPEREILELQAIRSLLVLPLVSDTRPFGYIGFDAVRSAKEWAPKTISLMKLAGGIIANALQRKHAEEIIHTELELARSLTSSSSFQATLESILQAACAISSMEAGGVYLVNPEKNGLELACHRGLSETFVKKVSFYTFESEQAKLVQEGNPVYCRYDQLVFSSAPETDRINYIAILPVSFQGKVIGCLNLGSSKLSTFPELAQKGLETVASRIGAAIMQARHEQYLETSKKNFESLFNSIDDLIFIIDENGKIVDTNTTVCSVLGYAKEALIGLNLLSLHPEGRREEAKSKLGQMLAGKETTCMVPVQKATGALIPVESKVASGKWNDRPVLFGISRDISERVRSEQALVESELRFRELAELLPLPLFEIDDSLTITYCNRKTCDVFGYSVEELSAGFHAARLCLPGQKLPITAFLRSMLDGKVVSNGNEHTAARKDGTRFPILCYSMPIVRDGKVKGVRAIIVDMTELKAAETAMRNSEIQESIAREFKSLIDNIPGAVYRINEKGVATMLSGLPETLPEISYNAYRSDLLETLDLVHPEDRQEVAAANRELPVTRQSATLTYRIVTGNGAVSWLEDRKTPTFSPDGAYTGIDGILFDITERVRSQEEKQMLESQLRQAQRLETIGTLAGGIAHDFNNILTPILGYAELGVISIDRDDPLYEYFAEIMQAAERAQTLVSQILTFSREQESVPSTVSVQAIVSEALKLLRPSIPSTITIELDVEPSCRNVMADPSQIHQVIVNLCTNAFQAMETGGGRLRIGLHELKHDDPIRLSHTSIRNGDFIHLSIADTGTGMDDATMERIFEPFFTTKSVNKGTGLGLSVVHGIVSSCNGEISVESAPEKGSVFHVYLPVIEEVGILETTEPLTMTTGSGRILLVDDELAAAQMMKQLITRLGFSIHAETSPVKALELFRQAPDSFDLVITDLTMPQMTGLQLAIELHRTKADLPVILMTGYGKNIDNAMPLSRYGISKLMKKPIKLTQLADTVNEVMSTINHNEQP